MKKALIALLFLSVQAYAQKGKVILAIFAHPDDENIIAPVLAKYAAEDADVYLAVVTDGRYGVTDFAHIPEGDSLAHVRAREIRCAANRLGIHPPILLGFPDKLRANEGKTQAVLDSVRERVVNLFREIKPDVVITWGANGWTGHPDHRLIGSVVTDVFTFQKWTKPYALYYPEIPTGYLPKQNNSYGTVYATVDLSYLTVRIVLNEADMAKAKAAIHCHQSQYTWDYAEQTHLRIWKSPHPVAFLRPLKPEGRIQHSLFK